MYIIYFTFFRMVAWTQPKGSQLVHILYSSLLPSGEIKSNNLTQSLRGYWTFRMYAAWVYIRLDLQGYWTLSYLVDIKLVSLKGGAREGSKLDNRMKQHLYRKQCHWLSYAPRPSLPFSWSIESEGSNGNIFAAGECYVYLDQL